MLVVALGPVSTLILGRESKANMAWPFAMKTKLAFYFYIKSTNPKSFLGLFFHTKVLKLPTNMLKPLIIF